MAIFQHYAWKGEHKIERIATEVKPVKSFRFQEQVPTIEQLHIEVENLANQVNSFSDKKIVFCHNDLLCANYVFDEQNGKLIMFNCKGFMTYAWIGRTIFYKNLAEIGSGEYLKFLSYNKSNKSVSSLDIYLYESVWYSMAGRVASATTKNGPNAPSPQ